MFRGCAVCALAGALFSAQCNQASAGLEIVSQNVHIDVPAQQVDFTINFSHAPDFQKVDLFGRPADSFQYEIIPNTTKPFSQFDFPLAIVSVVRGDEIGSGHLLPIRNGIQNGSDPNPASGGWGTCPWVRAIYTQRRSARLHRAFSMIGTSNGVFLL